MGIVQMILANQRIQKKIYNAIKINGIECECQINASSEESTLSGENCHCEMVIDVWNEDIPIKSHITQPIPSITVSANREVLS